MGLVGTRPLSALDARNLLRPTGVTRTSYPAAIGGVNNVFTPTSGTMHAQRVAFAAGDVIANVSFFATSVFTRGTNADSHLWFFVCTTAGVLVAITADDTSAAWASGSEKKLAIATIASGAAASYTVPSAGDLLVGLMVAIGTGGSPVVPNIGGLSLLGGAAKAPIELQNGDASKTTPLTFPFTVTLTGTARAAKLYCETS